MHSNSDMPYDRFVMNQIAGDFCIKNRAQHRWNIGHWNHGHRQLGNGDSDKKSSSQTSWTIRWMWWGGHFWESHWLVRDVTTTNSIRSAAKIITGWRGFFFSSHISDWAGAEDGRVEDSEIPLIAKTEVEKGKKAERGSRSFRNRSINRLTITLEVRHARCCQKSRHI